jgi:hypothetical protein
MIFLSSISGAVVEIVIFAMPQASRNGKKMPVVE